MTLFINFFMIVVGCCLRRHLPFPLPPPSVIQNVDCWLAPQKTGL